jgi:hypothetical protein
MVVSSDTALLKRIHQILTYLPLDAPGRPESGTPVTTDSPAEAARLVGQAHRNDMPFGLVITDRMDAARQVWHQATLPVLHVGLLEAGELAGAPADQLLLLPADPHPMMLQQAVLTLIGRAASERTLQAALEQEKEARQAEARGALDALSELVEQIDPDLARRAERITNLTTRTAAALDLPNAEALRVASRMSMLGMTRMSAALREKIRTGAPLEDHEERARRLQTRTAQKIISLLPGMEDAAQLLFFQAPTRRSQALHLHPQKRLEITILRLALEIDVRICSGLVPLTAIEDIESHPPLSLRPMVRDRNLMGAMHDACLQERDVKIAELRVDGLRPGMILYDNVYTTHGTLIVSKNQRIHLMLIDRLKRFSAGVGVRGPVKVLVPMSLGRVNRRRLAG